MGIATYSFPSHFLFLHFYCLLQIYDKGCLTFLHRNTWSKYKYNLLLYPLYDCFVFLVVVNVSAKMLLLPFILPVSHSFGFGLMDAAAMVDLARSWQRVPDQHVCSTAGVIGPL